MAAFSWSVADTFDGAAASSLIGSALTTSQFGSMWGRPDPEGLGDVVRTGSGSAQFNHPTSGLALDLHMTEVPDGAVYTSFHVTLGVDVSAASSPDIGLFMNVNGDTGDTPDVWIDISTNPSTSELRATAQNTSDEFTILPITGDSHTLEWVYEDGVLAWYVDSALITTEAIETFYAGPTSVKSFCRINGRDENIITDFSMTADLIGDDPIPRTAFWTALQGAREIL